jgi:outer membrane protein with beta-barrel domain
MKRPLLLFSALILSALLTFSDANAQEHDAPKVEVGAQYSSLSITPPDAFGTENGAGFGARVTYNLTDYFALEAEGNFYPTRMQQQFVKGGAAEQMQFGVKIGKRYNRFGVFGKARPGLISFGNTTRVTEGTFTFGNGTTIPIAVFGSERKTHFSTDVGGVLELYPSRRLLVRFDAGDTIIRYGEHNTAVPIFINPDVTSPISKAPAAFGHNFQFTAGVAYRFGGGGADDDSGNKSRAGGESDRKFEVGLQFSSLAFRLDQESFGSSSLDTAAFDAGTNTEAGFGGRVGYNINKNVAIEAEGNFYPRRGFPNSTTGGYPTQMQFGVKAGKRYERFGLFAKARPGFLSFSRVATLTSIETFTFNGQTFFFGNFEDRRRTYFSMDVGGVLELYPTKRIFTRFDAGDTMIRYGERNLRTFVASPSDLNIPAETRHNFQFTAGIGLRF